MAKTEGCWANMLNDCAGALTGEHLVSVAVWASESGKDNRAGRLDKSITVTMGAEGSPERTTVEDLVAPILCEHHNSSTNQLDTAGGKFARAIEEFMRVKSARDKSRAWPLHCVQVHGPYLERWFMKTAINNAVRFGMPIGAADARPGYPTNELVEIVYCGRPITRPMGLCLVDWEGNKHNFGESFSFMYYDRNSTHLAGCLITFRTLLFVVKFETYDTPAWMFRRVLGRPTAAVLQPFNALLSAVNVRVQLNWPKQRQNANPAR